MPLSKIEERLEKDITFLIDEMKTVMRGLEFASAAECCKNILWYARLGAAVHGKNWYCCEKCGDPRFGEPAHAEEAEEVNIEFREIITYTAKICPQCFAKQET